MLNKLLLVVAGFALCVGCATMIGGDTTVTVTTNKVLTQASQNKELFPALIKLKK